VPRQALRALARPERVRQARARLALQRRELVLLPQPASPLPVLLSPRSLLR
jgi:hypothetical protein